MFIYRITNSISNKFYIGKTKHSISQRFQEHINATRRGSLSHLHSAMRKYGEENFIIETIESVLPEQNMEEGCGEKNAMRRPECAKKISEIAKNRRKFVKPDGAWTWITIDEYQQLNHIKE